VIEAVARSERTSLEKQRLIVSHLVDLIPFLVNDLVLIPSAPVFIEHCFFSFRFEKLKSTGRITHVQIYYFCTKFLKTKKIPSIARGEITEDTKGDKEIMFPEKFIIS